jgi:hypothetical protein
VEGEGEISEARRNANSGIRAAYIPNPIGLSTKRFKKRMLDALAVVIYYCLNTGKEVIRKIYE